MKKIVLMLMATAMVAGAQAQTLTNNTGGVIGIRAGVNFQNLNGEDASGNDLDYDLLTGFHVGLTADLQVGTGFYLQPGVLYTMKGAKISNDSKLKLSYIEVPVNFIYKPALGTGSMLLGFGPYVAFAVGGEFEAGGNSSDIVFTSDFDPNNAAPQLKRMDAGANLLAGYEFANKFSFQLNAQLGLMEINPDTGDAADKSKLKNTGFGLSVGYRF